MIRIASLGQKVGLCNMTQTELDLAESQQLLMLQWVAARGSGPAGSFQAACAGCIMAMECKRCQSTQALLCSKEYLTCKQSEGSILDSRTGTRHGRVLHLP